MRMLALSWQAKVARIVNLAVSLGADGQTGRMLGPSALMMSTPTAPTAPICALNYNIRLHCPWHACMISFPIADSILQRHQFAKTAPILHRQRPDAPQDESVIFKGLNCERCRIRPAGFRAVCDRGFHRRPPRLEWRIFEIFHSTCAPTLICATSNSHSTFGGKRPSGTVLG